jgi:DNA-binding transcriptional MocR family regulator
VVEAYEQLVARGMLLARRGAGFFVAARAGQGGARAVFVPHEPVIDSAWLLSEMFADERVPIKAGCGWLPGKWLNDEGLHQAERRIIRSPGAQQVGYGHPYGYAPLRQLITQFGHWALELGIDQVLTTHGATQALDLVIRTMTQPGDTVMIDDPGYCNLIATLRLAGLNVIGVPRTPGGVDTDMLDTLARCTDPRCSSPPACCRTHRHLLYPGLRHARAAGRRAPWFLGGGRRHLPRAGPGHRPHAGLRLDGLQGDLRGQLFQDHRPSLRVGYIACQRELAPDRA